MKYERIVELVMERPWAILPRYLATIVDLVRFRAQGGLLTHEEISARIEAAGPRQAPAQAGPVGVAVLNVYGVLLPKANLMSEMSGGSSVEQLTSAFRQAMADPSVGGVVLNVDSPGGMVDGIPELAAEIRAARGSKPVLAVANTYAASAAYWLASQADELAVTPSGEVGSIGVFTAHDDLSAAYEQAGIRTTLISAGKYKVEGSDLGPLSDDALAYQQAQVDAYYQMFTRDVAAGRGVTPAAVRSGYGEGRMVMAADAVRLGMADRVATLDQTITRVARQIARQASAPATRSAFARAVDDGAAVRALALADDLAIGANATAELERRAQVLAPAIPAHKSPAIAPDDATWDAGAEVAAATGESQLRRMHAWVDPGGDPDAKSSYKLPHHRADGTLVPKGLFAAAQRLDGTDLPDGDRPGVKRHLGGHYDELDRTPPWEQAQAELELAQIRARAHRRGATMAATEGN